MSGQCPAETFVAKGFLSETLRRQGAGVRTEEDFRAQLLDSSPVCDLERVIISLPQVISYIKWGEQQLLCNTVPNVNVTVSELGAGQSGQPSDSTSTVSVWFLLLSFKTV